MWDVRGSDPMRVPGNEHHGSTFLAETAEVSQGFFQQFFSDRRNRLYKKGSEAAADTSNAEDVLRFRALLSRGSHVRNALLERRHS